MTRTAEAGMCAHADEHVKGSTSVPRKTAPEERGFPIVGVLPDMVRDAPSAFTSIAAKYRGEIVAVRIGPMTTYLVTHPDHVRHVLLDQRGEFGKGANWRKAAGPLFGNGIGVSEGDFWARQRRMMQPFFTPAYLASMVDSMVDSIELKIDGLQQKGPVVDMHKEMNAFTQQVLLDAMFSSSIGASESEFLANQVAIAFRRIALRLFLPFLPDRFPLPGNTAFRKAIAALDDAVLGLVQRRRASGEERADLLSKLMQATDIETGGEMTDTQLRDELIVLFAGGTESTAITMSWLWYEVDRHPEVDRRLRAEVAEVLGDRRPTYADLARLGYTRQVIEETLRLYPTGWILPRVCEQATQIGGYEIPAGAPILLCPFATHRDPTYWPDPDRFDPDRFAPGRAADRPRFSYVAFGGGPRHCIGATFAMMEAQLIVAMMARRFRPRIVPNHRVEISAGGTLPPRFGMKMILNAKS